MSVNSARLARRGQPIRCVVIQLGGRAQLLQTLMALRAAKQSFPELEIHIVVKSDQSGPAQHAPWLKEVIELPVDHVLEPFYSDEATRAEDRAIQRAAQWLSPLVQTQWDIALDWTFNDVGGTLAALLPADLRLGFLKTPEGTLQCMDDWSLYLQAVIQSEIPQNIHLTDLLTTQLLTLLQVEFDREEGANIPGADPFFRFTGTATRLRDEAAHWTSVAVQVGGHGAGTPWPVERLAELSTVLIQKYPNLRIVLMGGAEDLPRSQKFFERVRDLGFEPTRMISLVGKTDFETQARAIEESECLLSADPASIHLASILGTRVIYMSSGPSRFEEMGPYGNHHWIVRARSGIPSVGSIEALLECALGFRDLDAADVPDLDVYRSRVRSMDEGGGVTYLPLVPRPLTVLDWQKLVIGQLARAWYCGWTAPVGAEVRREALSPELLQALRALGESTLALDQVLIQAQRSAREICRMTSGLRSERLMGVEVRAQIQTLGQELAEVDGLMDRLSSVHQELRVFTQLRKVLLHNIEGDRLSEISARSAEAYELLQRGVKLYLEWIQYGLELAKPRSVEKRIDLI